MNAPLRSPRPTDAPGTREVPIEVITPDRAGAVRRAERGLRAWWNQRPRYVRRLTATATVLATLYLVRIPILVAVADVLSVEDRLRPADAILVLGGEIESRPVRAAELYKRGLAPRILLVGIRDDIAVQLGVFPNETAATARLLNALGVPFSAIVVIPGPGGGAASTTDEARALRDYVGRTGTRRVIVVTNNYHTRRARWNLQRSLDDSPVEILMASAPNAHFTERNWWRSEEGLIRVFEEYLKFAHNLVYR